MSNINQDNRIKTEKVLQSVLLPNLRQYVVKKLKEYFGDNWGNKFPVGSLDIQESLKIIKDDEKKIFKEFYQRRNQIEKTIIEELIYWRNNFAHNNDFTSYDVNRLIDCIRRFLKIVSSDMKIELLDEIQKEVSEDLSGIKDCKDNKLSIEISYPNLGEPRDFSSWSQKLSKAFYGREWLFDKIENWVVNGNENMLLLTGEPGVGKSAIMSQLVAKYRDNQLLAYHVCSADEDITLNPSFFTVNIMKMAAQNLIEYAEIVKSKNICRFIEIANEDPDNAFNEGFNDELLKVIPSVQTQMIIFVDALDEAYSRRGKNIVNFLSNKMNSLPGWIKIIATTRPNPEILLKFKTATRIDLNESEDNKNYDTITFIQNELPEFADKNELVEKTAIICDGNMLFTRLLIDDIKHRNFDLNIDTLNTLPKTVFEYYIKFIERDFPSSEEYDKISTLFKIFISSYEPLSLEQLAVITNESIQNVGRKINKISSFVENNDNKYSLYHQSFSDWLKSDELLSTPWSISFEEAHSIMILACMNIKTDRKSSLYKYALHYLPNHCIDGKQYKNAIELSRDNAFIYCQREKASLIQNTFQIAYQSACKIDDGIAMSEILLNAEKIYQDIRSEKPLDLIREGKWEEAKELLQFYTKQEVALWRLLLAWEADRQNNKVEMERFYEEIRRDGIPDIVNISHHIILAILAMRKNEIPADITKMYINILNDDIHIEEIEEINSWSIINDINIFSDIVPDIYKNINRIDYKIDNLEKSNPDDYDFIIKLFEDNTYNNILEYKLYLLSCMEKVKAINSLSLYGKYFELLWREGMNNECNELLTYILNFKIEINTDDVYIAAMSLAKCGFVDKAILLIGNFELFYYQNGLAHISIVLQSNDNVEKSIDVLSLALSKVNMNNYNKEITELLFLYDKSVVLLQIEHIKKLLSKVIVLSNEKSMINYCSKILNYLKSNNKKSVDLIQSFKIIFEKENMGNWNTWKEYFYGYLPYGLNYKEDDILLYENKILYNNIVELITKNNLDTAFKILSEYIINQIIEREKQYESDFLTVTDHEDTMDDVNFKQSMYSLSWVKIAHIAIEHNYNEIADKCLTNALIYLNKMNDDTSLIQKYKTRVSIADTYLKMNNKDKALFCYQGFDEDKYNDKYSGGDIFINLSFRYAMLGRLSESIYLCNKVKSYIISGVAPDNLDAEYMTIPFYMIAECFLDNGYYDEALETFVLVDSNVEVAFRKFASKLYDAGKIDYLKRLGEYCLKYTDTVGSMCAMFAAVYPKHANKIAQMILSRNEIEEFAD